MSFWHRKNVRCNILFPSEFFRILFQFFFAKLNQFFCSTYYSIFRCQLSSNIFVHNTYPRHQIYFCRDLFENRHASIVNPLTENHYAAIIKLIALGIININPFVPNAPFLYPLKVFGCFQGVQKGCVCNKWVNSIMLSMMSLQSSTNGASSLNRSH